MIYAKPRSSGSKLHVVDTSSGLPTAGRSLRTVCGSRFKWSFWSGFPLEAFGIDRSHVCARCNRHLVSINR